MIQINDNGILKMISDEEYEKRFGDLPNKTPPQFLPVNLMQFDLIAYTMSRMTFKNEKQKEVIRKILTKRYERGKNLKVFR